ncbi:MAG: 2-hydroxyacyl-CoA dehydratase [Desulfovibrionaceae bacterium]|nr:2-hydroxyacyl-CoA dehydratase [Desulfovibrionaceae bacterium]
MNCSSLAEFIKETDKNVLNLQKCKTSGQKVIGLYCIYAPIEIPLAAKAIPVSLCGTKNDSIPKAETVLPRTVCPLIKSSFGFALLDSCPYLAASDLVVAETTCDGKKKMYELLGNYKPVFLMQLPQIQNEAAKDYVKKEFQRLIARIEADFGVKIGDQDLREAIKLANSLRQALKEVLDLAKRKPSPLTGMEILNISFRTSFMPDYNHSIELLKNISKELSELTPDPTLSKRPRILLTGVPTGMGSHKVVELLETCGASVVCLDNCSVYKKVLLEVEEDGDLLDHLAKRYLDMHCAIMSPNPNRYAVLKTLIQEFSVDAVVDLTWQGCQTYEIESYSLKNWVHDTLKLPFLQIITDFSSSDTEQIKVRIEAFLEMLA